MGVRRTSSADALPPSMTGTRWFAPGVRLTGKPANSPRANLAFPSPQEVVNPEK